MKLPALSAREVIKVLTQHGYTIHDQKGSHIHLRHPTRLPLTVPNHGEIARGTLKAIIEASGLEVDDFV